MPTPPTPAAHGSQSTGEWLKTHRQEALLGAAGIVIAIALYVRSKSSSSSGTGTTGTTSGVVYPATADTTGSDLYNGLESQIQGLATSVQALPQYQGGPLPAGAAQSLVGPGQGYGVQDVQGQEYDSLGYLSGGGNFSGYNVGGGAPVFYLTPSGQLETDINSAAIAGLPKGTELLTPAAYGSQIGTSPVSNELIQAGK